VRAGRNRVMEEGRIPLADRRIADRLGLREVAPRA
jgi:hypothetical protein